MALFIYSYYISKAWTLIKIKVRKNILGTVKIASLETEGALANIDGSAEWSCGSKLAPKMKGP